ncbi:cytochrome b/b6 domain-containing protein [Sedimenticola thiotaurini]|uniref:Cytochrome B561 n=1 Tax=Sedimenticola thiotaurini TaxID=1543721 RepID=A0A0F7K2Q4_9GAMM|nr:cytochrome b/b6 domain-containing protein [Sedimenticola thiotaurini]AKH21854.1 cytochrome B561 [Sedimenticola thiotaurini]
MNQSEDKKIWDLFVRFFHWSLVAGFFIAYLTEDELAGLHIWAGYLVFSLVVLRIVWGVVGSRHARFSDFVYGPSQVIGFLKQTLAFKAPRYLGHNPAGGAMVVALLLSVLITAALGMLLFGTETQVGALGTVAATAGLNGELLEDLHEFFANFTLFLVAVHVVGVLFESYVHRENLVRSMLTGRKQA